MFGFAVKVAGGATCRAGVAGLSTGVGSRGNATTPRACSNAAANACFAKSMLTRRLTRVRTVNSLEDDLGLNQAYCRRSMQDPAATISSRRLLFASIAKIFSLVLETGPQPSSKPLSHLPRPVGPWVAEIVELGGLREGIVYGTACSTVATGNLLRSGRVFSLMDSGGSRKSQDSHALLGTPFPDVSY